LQKEGRFEEAVEVSRDRRGLLALVPVKKAMEKQVRQIRDARKLAYSPLSNMSGSERRALLTRLDEAERRLLSIIPRMREEADMPTKGWFPWS